VGKPQGKRSILGRIVGIDWTSLVYSMEVPLISFEPGMEAYRRQARTHELFGCLDELFSLSLTR
jgi:hypothetical protein